jgi:hypothetical protein
MTITLKGGPADGQVCDFPDGKRIDCIVVNVKVEGGFAPHTYDAQGIYFNDSSRDRSQF